MRKWLVVGALLLSACAKVDKPGMTEIIPVMGGFTFKATADASYPVTSESAEQTRIRWLEEYLRDNGICPAGYVITDRREILVSKAILADIVDITYEGACK